MGTKNKPGAFDCYANADPDEPMFVLLARDRHAPTLIWLWAVLRELDGEDPAKVEEARECVADMIAWGVERGRKYHGIGTATLAGGMELVRAANAGIELMNERPQNGATTTEQMRAMLARTLFPAMTDVGGEPDSGAGSA